MRIILIGLLAGVMLCNGCTVLQQEQAAVSRLGDPDGSSISSGDVRMYYYGITQEFLQYKNTWKNSTRRYYYLDKCVVVVANSHEVVIVDMDDWQYEGVRSMLERMSPHCPTSSAPQEGNGK